MLLNFKIADRIHRAPGLSEKVGSLCPSVTNLGTVSSYFCKRFGFSPDCCVAAFTGDNPASLAGAADEADDLVISLGTSDTGWCRL